VKHQYPANVFFSDEDGGFIATAPDLPGCSAFGETQEAAIRELQDAIEAWIVAAKKAGNPIPPASRSPEDRSLPSGKILLRLPRTLHAGLVELARREAVSLNQCVVSALSATVAANSVVATAVSAQWVTANVGAWTRFVSASKTFSQVAVGNVEPYYVMPGAEHFNLAALAAEKPVVVFPER